MPDSSAFGETLPHIKEMGETALDRYEKIVADMHPEYTSAKLHKNFKTSFILMMVLRMVSYGGRFYADRDSPLICGLQIASIRVRK